MTDAPVATAAAAALPSTSTASPVLAASEPPSLEPPSTPRISITIHSIRNISCLLAAPVPSSSPAASQLPLASPTSKTRKKGKEDQSQPDAANVVTVSCLLSFPTFASLTPPPPPPSYPTVPPASVAIYSPPIIVSSSSPPSLPVAFTHSESIASIPFLASALPSSQLTLSLLSLSPPTSASADKRKPDAKPKQSKAEPSAAQAPLYPADALTVVGTAPLSLQSLLEGEKSVRRWYAVGGGGGGGAEGSDVEVDVEVEVTEPLIQPEEAERCNNLTVTVGAVHNLPLVLVDDAGSGSTSRPGTAALSTPTAKATKSTTAKKDDRSDALSADAVFTLAFDVALGPTERRTVWTERGQSAVRRLTDEEKVEERKVTGRWREIQDIDRSPSTPSSPATDAAKIDAARTRPTTARKPQPKPSVALPVSSKPAATTDQDSNHPPLPLISSSVLCFDFSSSSFLCPAANSALAQAVQDDTLFPIQITMRRMMGAGEQVIVVGLALLDLHQLLMPGTVRMEGWFALTQTSAPAIVKGAGGDEKKKSKTAVTVTQAGTKKKEEGGGGDVMIDSLDACRSYVWISIALVKPLVPLPTPAATLPQTATPSPPSILHSFFPASLDFLSSPSPSTLSTLRATLRSLLGSLPHSAPDQRWHWQRRLEAVVADVVRERFTLKLGAESRTDEEDDMERAVMKNQLMAELMQEVTAIEKERDGEERVGGKYSTVHDAALRWGELAADAETMDDLQLSRHHHESRITAAQGWWDEDKTQQSEATLVSALYDYAGFALRRGEMDGAEVTLRRVLELQPQHVPATLLLSLILLESKSLWEATELLSPHATSLSSSQSPPHPLIAALLVLLYHHQEQDELKQDVITTTNTALSSSSPTSRHDDDLFSAALSSVPRCQCGWEWEQGGDVCLIGARYAMAFGIMGSAGVWLSGVMGGEALRELREGKEEKEGATRIGRAEEDDIERQSRDERGIEQMRETQTRCVAMLQYALLASSQQRHDLALQYAQRIIHTLDLTSSSPSSHLPLPLHLYLLTRLASLFHSAQRLEDAEALLTTYAGLIRVHASVPVDVASLSMLVRLLLSKQRRHVAVGVLLGVLGCDLVRCMSWVLLLYGEALYADGRWEEAASQVSAATVLDAANSRGDALLCCINSKLAKQKKEHANALQQKEERTHRRSSSSSSTSPPPPFQPSLHLRSLITTTAEYHDAALSHYAQFLSLTSTIPLPVSSSSLSLYLELGLCFYAARLLDQAEQCFTSALAIEGEGGAARQRLEWVASARAGVEIEGESEARRIQGLFRRVRMRKERGEREHKEVVLVQRKTVKPLRATTAVREGEELLSARIQALD